jgi:hypothetical protein
LDTTTNLGKTDPPPVATPMRFDNKSTLRQHAAYQPSRNNARKTFKFNEVIFAESLTARTAEAGRRAFGGEADPP